MWTGSVEVPERTRFGTRKWKTPVGPRVFSMNNRTDVPRGGLSWLRWWTRREMRGRHRNPRNWQRQCLNVGQPSCLALANCLGVHVLLCVVQGQDFSEEAEDRRTLRAELDADDDRVTACRSGLFAESADRETWDRDGRTV